MTLLAYEMSHKDVAALRDADTEEIDEHDHVVTVGSCGQCLIADLVDEVGDDHLRQTVRDILAHGWDADIEQVLDFSPREGTEIAEREAGDMYLEVDGCQ